MRATSVLALGSVLEEWKLLSKTDLKQINAKLDQANKFLVTRQYHESNKEMPQAKDFEQKYNTTIKEYVKLMQELREKKESVHPQFVLRSLQSESILYRGLLQQAEMCEAALRSLGPCQPVKNEPFKLTPKDPYPMSEEEKKKLATHTTNKNPYETSSGQSSNPYAQPAHTSYAQPVYQQQPLPPPIPVPVVTYPRCQALYQFSATQAHELSFNVGDVLNLMNTEGQWWQAELNGRQGMIPSNYVQRI